MDADQISPTALRKLRAHVRDLWRKYAEARRVALAARREVRKTDRGRIVAEDALSVALDTRYWAYEYQRQLNRAKVLPVVPHGGRVSPSALERLRTSSRLRISQS